MRPEASILHLDLDAFFAAVEQRDKPSLRGKPVIVGGLGGRGVVSTASYEARRFGVRSAMPMHEARRLCPHAAFLSGRFGAYRASSRIVMGLLRELSPLVEPLSLDEAYVDLAAGGVDCSSGAALVALAEDLRSRLHEATGGLTASVGLASSKFVAKLASELAKPDGVHLVPPGTEVEMIAPLPVRSIPGVGPVTYERLLRLGVETVAELRLASPTELRRELGPASSESLAALAYARDDRPVSAERESKSVSTEETFQVDIADLPTLQAIVLRQAEEVAAAVQRAGLFARTVTIKIKLGDFTSHTRSRTLSGATDSAEVYGEVAVSLLRGAADILPRGARLVGVGVTGFATVAQEALFAVREAGDESATVERAVRNPYPSVSVYRPGEDVAHTVHGSGWVWGTGLGRVTVRFETALTGPGPVRTFAVTDPDLHRVEIGAESADE
ncbi:MAG TPA: DNA polymerase IV [Propionibacteriaceae bacterium]|nr:DNA polymerase IV [Propionibacteriaceae bacterium]